jgi:surface polysaccharide O-acyltransferase-like enzyme
MDKKTERIATPDLLRGLAVLFMVQVHVMELLVREELYQGFWGNVSLFLGGVPAAPLFIVLMGWFLAWRQKSSSAMALRGVKLFLGGILLNIGLNATLLYRVWVSKEYAYLDPWAYIFGADILPFAGLALIIIAALKKILKENGWLWIAGGLLVAAVSPWASRTLDGLLPEYVLAFLGSELYWSYFPLFPWLLYPLTGYGAMLLSQKISFRSSQSLWLLPVLFLGAFQYGWKISTELERYYHHNLLFGLWALVFIILLAAAVHFWEKMYSQSGIGKYLQWTGRNVTAFYVFQWLLIGNLGTIYYQSLGYPAWLMLSILFILLSSGLVLIWKQKGKIAKMVYSPKQEGERK